MHVHLSVFQRLPGPSRTSKLSPVTQAGAAILPLYYILLAVFTIYCNFVREHLRGGIIEFVWQAKVIGSVA